MRNIKIIGIGLGLLLSTFAFSQTYHESDIMVSSKPVNISMKAEDGRLGFSIKAIHSKHGQIIDERKKAVDKRRQENLTEQFTSSEPRRKKNNLLEVEQSFGANFTTGTPADNNLAISNDGIIVSAVNSNVRFYDSLGNLLGLRTLSSISRDVGSFSSAYDPHVVYDPEFDRFILIFLSGYSSSNTNLLIGFSTTNNPLDDWNFYRIPGNVHGNNTWSDYPFIGITHDEVFIPVLLWRDGESGWDSEAEELIWQIDKKKGYDGDSLLYKYYDKIKVNGRQVWNTRPVWGSETVYGPHMYFLANRAIDEQNDSIFLFQITNTLASGKAELKTKIARANIPYGIPPSAFQPKRGDSLRTNYADIHSAFIQHGGIHFVSNTYASETNSAGIFYGIMSDLDSDEPKVEARIYSLDTLDLNYASMAYAGGGGIDRSVIINVLHSGRNTFPGTSVLFVNRNGEFGELQRIKSGVNNIDVLRSVQERWGDYTGIQRRYNRSGEVWLSGSYGNPNNGQNTWVAQVRNTDPQLSVDKYGQKAELSAFPNPARERIKVTVTVTERESYHFRLFDMKGRMLTDFGKHELDALGYSISFDVNQLQIGVYWLIAESEHTVLKKKLVVE